MMLAFVCSFLLQLLLCSCDSTAEQCSLLQLSNSEKESAVNVSTCSEEWNVQRRRREGSCSCRRRTGASDLVSGLTCTNDVISSCGDDCPIGWPEERKGWWEAAGAWCEIQPPPDNWTLKSCGEQGSTEVKILTYNLFWWNLFDQNWGRDKSAGRLIASSSGPDHYDIMGFQECNVKERIMSDAIEVGLPDEYEIFDGGDAFRDRSICVAYRKTRWQLLEWGMDFVGEDNWAQYYGKRAAMWLRLQEASGLVVFFMNHHGPLPVNQRGGCAGIATAYNILNLIAGNAHDTDKIILVGDFNSDLSSDRIPELSDRLHRVYTGVAMGGVDHIFSNCNNATGFNLGKGGSDHDALSVNFTF